jgi:uncharacterized repeat protein (TIGR01451 family)
MTMRRLGIIRPFALVVVLGFWDVHRLMAAPALTISKNAPTSVPAGQNLTYTITYGNTGPDPAGNVSITDQLPTGTTFVSATGGGIFANGFINWAIGTVSAGSTGLTVSFTVNVTALSGTINNDNYLITAPGIPPVTGAPVSTVVCTLPVAAASATSPSICPGGSTTLMGSGGKTCSWQPLSGLSDPTSCNPTASPQVTTTYVLTVSDACGPSINTASVTITVTTQPDGPGVTAPSSVEAGQTGFSASITSLNPKSRYTWSITNGTITSATTGSSIVFTAGVVGTLTLSVTETNGDCVSKPTLDDIAVVPACVAPVAPTSPQIAAVGGQPGGSVTGIDYLDLSWTAPSPAPPMYLWALNGNPTQSTTAVLVPDQPPTGSNDSITLTVRGACSESVFSPAASVTVSPMPPGPQFSVPSPVGAGTSVTVTDVSEPDATSWTWLFGDGPLDPATDLTQSASHVYQTPGTYTIWLIASNGAGAASVSQSITVTASGTSTTIRATQSRTFDASNPERQRLAAVDLAGRDDRWLHIVSREESTEAIAFLRFIDPEGRLILERRLSVAPGQDATFDLKAYGLVGTYDLELVSTEHVIASITEPRAREPREIERGER